MSKVPQSPVPRRRRIPLSRFWLDWRISLFLVAVCILVVLAAAMTLLSGQKTIPSIANPSPATHRERAQFFEGLGKSKDAIREYQAAIRLSPEDAGLHEALAFLYEREGRFAEAITSYERSLQLAPESEKSASIRSRVDELRRRR
ncbi:MAG: tetratricopeptide repeat protein [Candidatus Methylomirabilales bacterium]